MIERRLGPYRLLHQLAVGGMAEVYVAAAGGAAGFEKYVALKVIHQKFSDDEEFAEMLVEEAKLAVQLQHANIVQTFDLGKVGSTYYMVMELIEGADVYRILRRTVERGERLPFEIAAFIAREVCAGLDYAHRKQDREGRPLSIIHRDISPQNILVSEEGAVKIVDFGIAKAAWRERQTAAGVIKGKSNYMSPEQAWGQALDHRTDIFSAGIVLHELLACRPLYGDSEGDGLLRAVRRASIRPPSSRRPGIPVELERITMKALAPTPDARWQSAGEMAQALSAWLHEEAPRFTSERIGELVRGVVEPTETRLWRRPADEHSSRAAAEPTRELQSFADEYSLLGVAGVRPTESTAVDQVYQAPPDMAAPAGPLAPSREIGRLPSVVLEPTLALPQEQTALPPSGRASSTDEVLPLLAPRRRSSDRWILVVAFLGALIVALAAWLGYGD